MLCPSDEIRRDHQEQVYRAVKGSEIRFSSQSDDPLLDSIFVDQLRTFFWSSASPAIFAGLASQHVLLLKCTHPGATRHPSKDGIKIKKRFETQLKVSESS